MIDNVNLYLKIEEIRKARGLSTAWLCQDIISERTYYRYLNGESGVRYKVLDPLLKRLNLDLIDLIAFCNSEEDITHLVNGFIYYMFTLNFSNLKGLYEKIRKYKDKNLLYQRFIDSNCYKYRYLTRDITKDTYIKLLRKCISDLYQVNDENIYKQYIQFELFFVNPTQNIIKKYYEMLMNCDYYKNPLLGIISIDNFLDQGIKKRLLSLEQMQLMYKKYRSIIRYFHYSRPFTKLDLYRAYIEKYFNNIGISEKYIIKYLNSIIMTDAGKYIRDELKEIKNDFGYDYKEFINRMNDSTFRGPDSRFIIVKRNENKLIIK